MSWTERETMNEQKRRILFCLADAAPTAVTEWLLRDWTSALDGDTFRQILAEMKRDGQIQELWPPGAALWKLTEQGGKETITELRGLVIELLELLRTCGLS